MCEEQEVLYLSIWECLVFNVALESLVNLTKHYCFFGFFLLFLNLLLVCDTVFDL